MAVPTKALGSYRRIKRAETESHEYEPAARSGNRCIHPGTPRDKTGGVRQWLRSSASILGSLYGMREKTRAVNYRATRAL